MSRILRCKGCDRPFEKRNHNQLFHSLRCANRHRQRQHQKRVVKAMKMMAEQAKIRKTLGKA